MTKLSASFNKQLLEYWGFVKKCISEEVPRGFFIRTVIVNRGNSCELKPKKTFLSCINEQIYISLRKSSKRTNPEWHFKIFTFASQRRLVELLSYGEYNHLFISVVCFLKTTHLSVYRFEWLIFFSITKKSSTNIIFLPLKNIDHSNTVFKTE